MKRFSVSLRVVVRHNSAKAATAAPEQHSDSASPAARSKSVLREFLAGVTLALVLGIVPAFGQIPQPPSLPAEPLGPNDLIGLTVYGAIDLTRSFRVGPDGLLRLPLLPQPIRVNGVLPSQLEAIISNDLKTEKIMVDPVVSVSVLEYGSRPVTVMGAVRTPVTFQAAGTLTVLDALARAGGLATEAGPEILLTRPRAVSASETTPETLHIPVRKLINEAVPELNYRLYGGEQIRVPEAQKIYVLGNVKHGGGFVAKDPTEASVLKLLAQAEGLSPFAQNDGYVYRRDRSGNPVEIEVPVKKILQHKAEDIALLPNDVLYIPDAKGRRLTAEAIDRILGLGSTFATGYLLYGR